jgi:hypothetical protein
MGLITNGHRNGFSPFRWMSGNLTTIQNGMSIRNGYLPGKLHNWQLYGERQAGLPNGNLPPYCWLLPRVSGNMSMRTEGDGDLSANLIPTINGSIDFTGSGDLSAEAALVISMFCDMVGSGSLTANIVGLLNMSIDLEGSGDLSAGLSGIANMIIDLTGSGDLDATIAAYGNMEIDIVVTGTGLSTSNVGQFVWTSVLSQFDDNPNSAAAKLLAAASGGGGGGGGGIVLNSGTVDDSTLWQTVIESSASSDNNIYVGSKLVITTGPGAGQFRVIKNYNGASKICFVEPPWFVAPESTSEYSIIP